MTDSKLNISIKSITSANADEISTIYIPIFEDHPWHQEFECNCGEGPYSFGCHREMENNDPFSCKTFKEKKAIPIRDSEGSCKSCGQPFNISIKPLWTHLSVKTEFEASMNQEDFVGYFAERFQKIIGFCWGYKYPERDPKRTSTSTYSNFQELTADLEKKGVNLEKTFFHNECGVLYEHRGIGVGKNLTKSLLDRIRNSNRYDFVYFSTRNSAVLRCYESILNEDGISFQDAEIFNQGSKHVLDIRKFREKHNL